MTPPRSPPLFEITPASRTYHSGGTVSLKRTCRGLLLAELPGGRSAFQKLTENKKSKNKTDPEGSVISLFR